MRAVNGSAYVALDSSLTGDSWRLGLQRSETIVRCEADGRTCALYEAGRIVRRFEGPLEALDWFGQGQGRWVGYLSYDLGRWFERLPARAEDDLRLPLLAFARVTGEGEDARPEPVELSAAALTSNFSRQAYIEAVERAIEYIRAGDIFQVNLSQRFMAGLPVQPIEIYRRLSERFPAAYGAYLDFGDHALICNSPELFLRVIPESRRVITRPIKGTRPRLPGMEEELRASVKDQAELNMIVDLERNDLGRVCEIGSVRVSQPRAIEAHPTVYHGVATVEGVLRRGVGLVDLLRATFPGGSVTGAPKIRAMEIIDELEPTRRGPYCGAIGYIAADGSMEFNVAIRTMIVKGGRVHIPVGGGVVADSSPEGEYEETLVKARAMFEVLEVAVD
ncbi:MAG TPA: anthranilate synthase component I family protein [Tepidisphaeraceae bacterium]|jgi:para-aminobenzoate synthetase component 1